MSAAEVERPAPSRVVVVDDTVDLRDLICFALRRSHDFDVVGEAGNGREAIEVVGEVQPDVVLLDLAMPVMDGLEALPHVRRLVPSATILVFSGFSAGTMARQALESGADGYLQKGMPVKQILNHLRTVAGLVSTEQAPRPPAAGDSDPPPTPGGGSTFSAGAGGPAVPSSGFGGPGPGGLPLQRSGVFDTAFDDIA